MHTRKVMAVLLAASLGVVLAGCQRSDSENAPPQSKMDSPVRQGMAPAAPAQGSDSTTTAGAKQGDNPANSQGNTSTATAPAQPSDTANSTASPNEDRSKSGEVAKSKSSG